MRKITTTIISLFISTYLFSQCYAVSYIQYNPYPFGGTTVNSLADDEYSEVISIGFPFCFYGASYNSLVVGSNALISFDTSKAYSYCSWPINSLSLPSLSSEVKNCILFPWNDLYNQVGKFRYSIYGAVPNRTFIVTIDSVPLLSCPGLLESSQVILYETTNVIDIFVHNKPVCASWNGGRAILGIQNSLGSMGISDTVVTGTIPVTDIGIRFTPSCNVCTGVGIENVDLKEQDVQLFPNPTTSELIIQNSELLIKEIEIYSSLGEKVFYQPQTTNHQLQTIDVSQLPPGIYFITVTDHAGNKVTRKVVKM